MKHVEKSLSMYAVVVALCAAVMVTISASADAAVIPLSATLEGIQEVPPVATAGSGKASVFYNDDTNQLDWLVVFGGLSGPAIGAHFHGPAGMGVNAGIQVDVGQISGLNSPMLGSAILTEAQESQLLSGLWYFNVHTNLFTGGEIRGQVISSTASSSQRLLSGDLDGNGSEDLVGLTTAGQIFYSLDLATWQNLPGVLSQLAIGDLNGDGRDDIAGISLDGQIFYTLNLSTWQNIPGRLAQLVAGDLNGDGKDELAGVTTEGQVFYTLDLLTWLNIPGSLGQLTTGNLTGGAASDLAGLSGSGDVYFTDDLQTWRNIPGKF